jgi:hypothetical protein
MPNGHNDSVTKGQEGAADNRSFPPHSVEAEQSVLGALMIDAGAWAKIADVLRGEDVHRHDHRLIFLAISALATTGRPIDVVTVQDELGRTAKLDDAGGLAYLGALARDTPTAANVRAYAGIVVERSRVRQLQRIGTEIADATRAGSASGAILARLRLYLEKFPTGDGTADQQHANSGWQAPAIATYGASFNASAIPERQWLLGRRRSVGEVTIDAGPPGCNKSTLMLTDAVSIATGRRILDYVHRTGSVLFLAGEDARRDVEARLAGILAHYQITPEELGDRLHVVYLAETDILSYSLADMDQDLAMLNEQMLTWLREFPDVIAVFIDPIAAWHRLMENSNEAQRLLASAIRSIAVRGNRHVGFDHHVSKASQLDAEAHVGNLSALRGASDIAAAARWAFTMARITPQTAQAHGIDEVDRKRFRRLDALKASYGPDDEEARLFRVESVRIANGETVGVLVEVDLDSTRAAAVDRKVQAAEETSSKVAAALTRMLAEKRPRSAQQAALWLLRHTPELFLGKGGAPLSEFTLRRKLPALIGAGLETTFEDQPTRIVIIEPDKPGKGFAIDFVDSPDQPPGVTANGPL